MSAGAENRSKVLDGLRGLAVLQVVIFHYYLLGPNEADWYLLLRRLGGVVDGLTMFFVLSGFLIGGILLDTRTASGMLRVYYWRRAWRILPLYLLLLATYGVSMLVDLHWRVGLLDYWYSEFPFWNYLVFWQNERMVRDGVIGAPWLAVTWSLAVEMQFYLIVPWVVRYVSNRSLLLLGTVCVLAGPFLRNSGRPYLLVDRLDALAAGVLLAVVMRDTVGQTLLARSLSVLRVLVVAYLIALTVLRAAHVASPVLDSLTTTSLVYAGLIYLLTDGTAGRGIKPAIEVFAVFGLLSYFIYLFHMPVVYLFGVFLPQAVAAALPVTVGLAALSYRYFEQPLISLGRRRAVGGLARR